MLRRRSHRMLPCLVLAMLVGCACDDGPRRPAGSGDVGVSMDAPPSLLDASEPDGARSDAVVVDDASSADDARLAPDTSAPVDAAAADDAPAREDASPRDAAIAGDSGCEIGTSRACAIDCGMGTSAPGREICRGGGTWSPCERVPEMCGNGSDDDVDGRVDEGCREEGGCIWIRASCQGLGTLNQVCARSGRPRLVEGRRCPVAGGDTTPLDSVYGEYQLACCDVASTCRPECTGDLCRSSVVWDEIRCCP